jgi:hypothetical protein
MKKLFLKLSDSLLSREETKGIKGGGPYPPNGGGGGGTTLNVWCWSNNGSKAFQSYTCPSYSTAEFLCKLQFGPAYQFSQCN